MRWLRVYEDGDLAKFRLESFETSSFGLGWARYDDGQYTLASPYSFTGGVAFTVPNDANSVIDIHKHSSIDYYDGSKIYGEFENDVYILSIAFKSSISNANGYIELYLEGGNGTPYDRVRDIIVFPKGNNVEHSYTKTLQFYADDDVIVNGLTVKMLPSDNGQIHDVIYFIQRAQCYPY